MYTDKEQRKKRSFNFNVDLKHSFWPETLVGHPLFCSTQTLLNSNLIKTVSANGQLVVLTKSYEQ